MCLGYTFKTYNDNLKLQRGEGPIVLVMAPTRELAMQIEAQAKKFAAAC